jgi:PAS domain-containing protein
MLSRRTPVAVARSVEEGQGLLNDTATVQATHARLQAAIENARAGVWDVDLQTGQMVWDATVCRQYGVTQSRTSLAAWLALVGEPTRACEVAS